MPETLTCAQCQELLPWYVGEAQTTLHAALAQHLATCEDCRMALEAWQGIAMQVRDDVAASPMLPTSDQSWMAIQAGLATLPAEVLLSGATDGEEQPAMLVTAAMSPTPPARLWSRRLRAIVSVAALVALFAGVFAWYHAEQHPSYHSRPASTTPSTPDLCSPVTAVTNGFPGITTQVTVDHALADLSGTDVYARFSNTSSTFIFPIGMQVVDCMGNVYGADGGSSWGDPEQYVLKLESEFAPLPAAMQGKTVTLYLKITEVGFQTPGGQSPPPEKGLWQIPFMVHVADNARVVPIHATPIEHAGLTIAPTYVAWLQGISTSNVILGDVRIHLHLSGLPRQGVYYDGFQYATPPGKSHSSQVFVGNLIQLRLPSGQLVEPSFADFVNRLSLSTSSTGEADVDVDFDIPALTGAQMNTLVIDSFDVANQSYHRISYFGPWSYQIPNA